MKIKQDIEDLLEITQTLKRETRLRVLRNILKILLIGFFVGRDIDRKISETRSRRNLIAERIRGYFDEIEGLLKRLGETKRIDAFTARVNERESLTTLLALGRDLRFMVTEKAKEGLALAGKEDSERYNEIALNCAREYLEQRKHSVDKRIEEIRNSGTYLIYPEKEHVNEMARLLIDDLEHFISNDTLPEFCPQTRAEMEEYLPIVLNYNSEFVKQRKKEYDYLFNKDRLSLDEEQKEAVVTDDKYNLVIAGAGAGKTEVLITRIAYLIKRKPDSVQSRRILAIAYQNKDVRQIERRLHERYDIDDVEIKTFHKLGKELLQMTGRKLDRNSIVDENKKHEVVRTFYKNRLTEPDFYRLFLQYVRTIHDDEKEDNSNNKTENLE